MNKAKSALQTIILSSVFSSLILFSFGSNQAAFAQSTQQQRPNRTPIPATGLYNNEDGSPLISLVQSAKKTIDIEIYQMENAAFIESLRDALKRKVKVRIVKDPTPLGETCKLFPAPTDVVPTDAACVNQHQLKAEIIAAGGAFVAFNKPQLCADSSKNCFQHGKLVIADRKTALISTGNFNDSNLCDLNANPKPTRCNRDFSIITNDQNALNALNQIIEKDLKAVRYDLNSILSSTGQDSNPSSSTAVLTVSPLSLTPLVAFIDSAKKTLDIQNQYLNEPTLNAAILRAAARGVKVKLMVASVCSFGPPSPKKIEDTKRIYGAFDAAGVYTRMFTSKIQIRGINGYLHSKVFLVDNKRAWIGSVNGSTSAASNNREFGLFTSEPKDISNLTKTLDSDLNDRDGETWEESTRCLKDDPIERA
jgi:phosphatidylserine/phosphatidylglycerophosphate/cardiolipin synthase-like enzyme